MRLTEQVTGARYSIFYTNPRLFAEIEGRDVIVYYDRESFEQPAQIVAASRFTVGSREFYPGDYVCDAEHFERVGSFLDGDRSGHDVRKAWKNAVMTIYGRASIHAPSRQRPMSLVAQREENKAASQGSTESRPTTKSFELGQPTPFAKTVDGRPGASGTCQQSVPAKESKRMQGVSDEEFERQAAKLERSEVRVMPKPILVED